MTGEERDTGLRRLQLASLAVCGILLLMVLFTMLFSLASKNSASAVKDGNDAATCRAAYSAKVTDARTHLDDARADLTKAQFDGLVAATVTPDSAGLLAAIATGNNAKTLMQVWQRRTLDANDDYQTLIATFTKAPDQFRAMCQDGP
jgi:hypothetical protein